ncbi:BnaC03g73990D, partial [Brassica napus]
MRTQCFVWIFFTQVWCRRCFNHLGVLHVQVISCSLYRDDDTWKAWLN